MLLPVVVLMVEGGVCLVVAVVLYYVEVFDVVVQDEDFVQEEEVGAVSSVSLYHQYDYM